MKLVALCSLIAFGSFGRAQLSPVNDFVLSGETAFGMLGAEPASGGGAQRIAWSDDGKYLLSVRTDMGRAAVLQPKLTNRDDPPTAPETAITIYNVAERKQMVAWHGPLLSSQALEVQWFRGTSTALAHIQRRPIPGTGNSTDIREELILIDGQTAQVRTLLTASAGALRVNLSPTKPFAIIGTEILELNPNQKSAESAPSSWKTSYRLVNSSGTVSEPLPVDDAAFLTGWSADGTSPILQRFGIGSDGKRWRQIQLLDLQTGRLTPFDRTKTTAFSPPETPKGRIWIEEGSGAVSAKETRRDLHPAWLVGADEGQRALIGADVANAILSPTKNSVAYIEQGVALVRGIVQVPKDIYLNGLLAAEKARIISNAKQVGLALIMFASDSDDTLPPTQSDVGKLIEPYLKNRDLYSGFVYSFAGGALQDVKEPASTVMGYIPGPGGRAVVYVDGHVRWQMDP